MPKEFYQIQIKKQALKFAAAHMTIFPNGTKEALHGHNYQVGITLNTRTSELSKMVSFGDIKKILAKVCNQWDEKVLIATNTKKYELVLKNKKEIEFKLCNKRYVLPMDEVELLNTDNITTERLSEIFALQISADIKRICKKAKLINFSITVEESPGQGSSYTITA